MTKTIGIISIKGGVGKTTSVSNLAASLANQFNKKVLVIDANFTAPNLGIHHGIVTPEKTLHDVMRKKVNINNAIHATKYGFDIIPGKLNVNLPLNHLTLKNRLKELKVGYDYILLDSSPNLNNEILATMISSDILFVVTTPDYPTLSTTLHAIKIAKQKRTKIAGLILNRVYNQNFELSIEDIEKASECNVVAVIPHDISIIEALSKTMPAQLSAPKREAIIEYNRLAGAICNEDYKDPRFFTRITSFLRKDTKQAENRRDLAKNA